MSPIPEEMGAFFDIRTLTYESYARPCVGLPQNDQYNDELR